MKKSALFLTLFIGFCAKTIAQEESKPQINVKGVNEKIYTPTVAKPGQAEFIGFRNPPTEDLNWQPSLSKISKNESEDDEMLEKIKAEKEKLRQLYKASGNNIQTAEKTTILQAPTLDTNFAGIDNGGTSTPLDNTIAISNGGKIVAMVNSKVRYYSTSGAILYTNTLATLIGASAIGVSTNLCDPKVIYDNVKDRFFFYVQTCDATSASSKVILGCSKTNDPSAGWNIYKLTGNPLGDGSWFDYPKMAISTNEIFITGNLFYEGSNSFNESVIYQIDKAVPMAGGTTLSWQYWSGLTSAFTILPVSYGIKGSYGPGMYCVSNIGNAGGIYYVRLYDITNTKASGVATIHTYNVETDAYSAAGNADQQGTTHKLNTGDARILDGFYLHGYIHYVFNTDVGSGYCGISYNRLKIQSLTNTAVTYGHVGTSDVSYPAVAAITSDSLDRSVVIAFNESSTTFFPRTAAITVGHNLGWSSPTIVKAGLGYVNYGFGGATDRWGDYNGMCKRYNDNGNSLWMAGMYGSAAHTWFQWIAKLKGKTNIGVPEITEEAQEMKVYPNPVVDEYHIAFKLKARQHLTINITDMTGKLVKELYNGEAEDGDNMFSFNKANLSTGTYLLTIMGETKILKSEKIIIESK